MVLFTTIVHSPPIATQCISCSKRASLYGVIHHCNKPIATQCIVNVSYVALILEIPCSGGFICSDSKLIHLVHSSLRCGIELVLSWFLTDTEYHTCNAVFFCIVHMLLFLCIVHHSNVRVLSNHAVFEA